MNRPTPLPVSRGSAAGRNQAGAALVVGLVLLLVMTVLGVSGMNTATLELTMTSNAQSHQAAFQAAETGVELALEQRNFSTAAATTIAATAVGAGEVTVSTEFQETTPVPDIAFSMGAGSGGVQAFHFISEATGQGPRGASSVHEQHFYVVGPGTP